MSTCLTNTRLVLCTCPDQTTAESLAHLLVKQKLAAGVNILPVSRSIYRWQGKIEAHAEVLMLIETTAERYFSLETALAEAHPYEVPKIVALSVEHGLASYLTWVSNNVSASA